MALGDEFYLSAFSELNTCRRAGFGLGPIPWTAIIAFAEQYELEYDLKSTFLRVIRALDQEFLEYKAEKGKNDGSV